MLEVVGLNQSYGQSHTLWDIALSVPKVVREPDRPQRRRQDDAARLLDGAIQTHSGTITFDGKDLTRRARDCAHRSASASCRKAA